MASKIYKHFWDGGSGFNDIKVLVGYCREEPVEVLKSLIKTHVIHSYRQGFCRPIDKYPANCSGLVINEFKSEVQEDFGLSITKGIEDYKDVIKEFEWDGFDLSLFEDKVNRTKKYAESFDDKNACKEIYSRVHEDFKQVFDEINNNQEAVE